MNIEKIEIKYVKKYNPGYLTEEGLRHVKVLPWLSVVQSVEGSYDIQIGTEKEYKTDEGGFFISPSKTLQTIVHHLNSNSGRMKNRWIFFDATINGKYRLDFLYEFPTIVPHYESLILNDLFDKLFESTSICDEYSIYYQILKVLLSIAIFKPKIENESIQKVIEYIDKNYRSPISVKQLANLACMSESNLYFLFKKYMGVSPIAYTNYFRITMAEEYLLQSNLTIGEISELVGFDDQLYFSKLFRRIYGISPRKYRQSNIQNDVVK